MFTQRISYLLSATAILCLTVTVEALARTSSSTDRSGSISCDETDDEGWTRPSPSRLDPQTPLMSPRQKGSRIIYISNARGNDESGEFYFWNGFRLVDSKGSSHNSEGIEYGRHPSRPSQVIRPFKHWNPVAPRNDGAELLNKNPTFGTTPTTRMGFPDWWLFARNETYDLTEDFGSVIPNPVGKPNFIASLATSGGRSATEPQVVSAYGSLCLPRPRFVNPINDFITRFESKYVPPFRNVLYSSLHFDGRGAREGTSALFLLGQISDAKALVFEDIWFDASGINIGQKNDGQITIRRSILTDVFSASGKRHAQGIYTDGGPKGVFRIEESILMRNGFRGDPAKFSWPPKGDQVWNIFNRNMYLSGATESMLSGFFDSISMMGASGDQFRWGGRIERSFFYQGYLMLGGSGGRPEADGPSGVILDSVLQRFQGTGTNDNRGHPGWGIELSWGANEVEVSRNIVTGAQHFARTPAMKISPYDLCPYLLPTRENRISGNIFDSGSAAAAISSLDGVSYYQTCTQPWTYPGVTGNSASNNVLINATGRAHIYLPKAGAAGTNSDTLVRSNIILANRADGIAQLKWTEPNRTLKTYLESKGIPVVSEDGFPEYFQIARKMQRGRWDPTWSARSIVNHFRSGFNMPSLD
jgi:hypothetical protein